MKLCYRCGNEVEVGRTVGRTEACPHCDADLHCCLNCTFYDKTAHHECHEPQAEPVGDKEKGNFCDYFVFKESKETRASDDKSPTAREKLDKLFRKK